MKCPKELMLTKPMVCMSVLFATLRYLLNINISFQPEVCNECHDLIQKAINFNDAALVAVKEND